MSEIVSQSNALSGYNTYTLQSSAVLRDTKFGEMNSHVVTISCNDAPPILTLQISVTINAFDVSELNAFIENVENNREGGICFGMGCYVDEFKYSNGTFVVITNGESKMTFRLQLCEDERKQFADGLRQLSENIATEIRSALLPWDKRY